MFYSVKMYVKFNFVIPICYINLIVFIKYFNYLLIFYRHIMMADFLQFLVHLLFVFDRSYYIFAAVLLC